MSNDLKMTVVAGADLAELFKSGESQARIIIDREFGHGLLDLSRAMKRNVKKNFHRHSGDFSRSVTIGETTRSSAELSAEVGSPEEYAEIQEKGGEVSAKNVRNLTIPLEAFMTGRGVARGSARDVIASPGNYGYDGTFFTGNVLMGKRGEETEPLFFLTPSVTIPARPWAQPALDEVKPQFESRVTSALEALL